VAVVFQLDKRIQALEKRLDSSADLVKAMNRLNAAFLGPGDEDGHAEGVWDSLKVIDRIGSRLAAHTPALRRVVRFSIGIDLRYFYEKTEITVEDLKGVESQISSSGVFWPADEIIIEEWATHTEVWHHSRRQIVFYPGEHSWAPTVIWGHLLPQRQDERGAPSLQVVLHEGSIKFWALNGRFGRHKLLEAQEENVFVDIPLKGVGLANFLCKKEPNDDPEFRILEYSWLRRYSWGNLEAPDFKKWDLSITDIVASVANPFPEPVARASRIHNNPSS